MLRLLPLTSISVIVASFESVLFCKVYGNWLNYPLDLCGALFACFGIQAGWATSNPMINNPIWYISVLLLCYLVMYILTFYAYKKNFSPYYLYIFIILVGLGCQTYGINLPFLNELSSRGYIAFFAGLVYEKISRKHELQKWTIQVGGLLGCVVMFLLIKFTQITITINMVVFILWPLVLIVANSKYLSYIINRKLWSRWAEISFSVYIWHAVIIIGFLFMPESYRLLLNSKTGLLITCFLMQIIGFISNRCIERPLHRRLSGIKISRV